MHVLAQNNAWKRGGSHGNHWLCSIDYCFDRACAEQPHTKEGLKLMKTCETSIKREDQNRWTKVETTGEGLKIDPSGLG